MTRRSDLTFDEWTWLVKIYQHEEGVPPAAVLTRLGELGLTEAGHGVSDAGRVFLDHELLAERRSKLQDRQ